jgi:hypothetical protein
MREEKGSLLTGGWQAGQSREGAKRHLVLSSNLASLPAASWPVAFLL